MRILFMTSSLFALPSLSKLLLQEEIIGVVTQPIKENKSRKKRKVFSIEQFCKEKKIKIFQPEKIKSDLFISQIKNLKPEIIIIVAYGQTLSKAIIEIPSYRAINLHPSLLPKYRGAAPINWAIINGEEETGVTTFFLTEKQDAGEIILQEKVKIEKKDTYTTLYNKLSNIGAEVLVKTLSLIKQGEIKSFAQDEKKVKKAPRILKNNCIINWGKKAEEIYNFVRGLNNTPGAFTFIDSKRLKIWQVEVCKSFKKGKPGEILALEKDKGIEVNTGKGQVLLKEVQLEGKKKVDIKDFINGYKIKRGTILGEKSKF